MLEAKSLKSGMIKMLLERDGDTLKVTVKECSQLKDMDFYGRNDVYVIVKVNNVSQRTPTAEDAGSAPKWNVKPGAPGAPPRHFLALDGAQCTVCAVAAHTVL